MRSMVEGRATGAAPLAPPPPPSAVPLSRFAGEDIAGMMAHSHGDNG